MFLRYTAYAVLALMVVAPATTSADSCGFCDRNPHTCSAPFELVQEIVRRWQGAVELAKRAGGVDAGDALTRGDRTLGEHVGQVVVVEPPRARNL